MMPYRENAYVAPPPPPSPGMLVRWVQRRREAREAALARREAEATRVAKVRLARRIHADLTAHVHAQYSELAQLGGLTRTEWLAAIETWPKRKNAPNMAGYALLNWLNEECRWGERLPR